LLKAGSAVTVESTLAGNAGLAAASIAHPASLSGAHTRLSLNENAFGCSARVVEAIRRNLTDLPRYTESEAHALSAQIAVKEGVLPEQIVLGEVLPALGLQLGLEGGPGGQFIYSQPGFTDLVLAAQQTGGTAVGIDLNDRLENDLPAIRDRVNTNTRAVFIVNPHNPSGTVTDNNTLRSFVSGNFVFFESGYAHQELATAFLAQGIDVGRSFPPLDRWARISIGLPEENERAIGVLRKIIREHQ
jgi:histidinol-phosphate/aromatic aminotransferase/cobyric acid decarboxylase-like protein